MKSYKQSTVLLLSLFCLLGTTIGAGQPLRQAQDRPNVLFIAIDDLNDWTEMLNGNPQAKTPNMAKQPVRDPRDERCAEGRVIAGQPARPGARPFPGRPPWHTGRVVHAP